MDSNTAWAIGSTQNGANWAVLATTNGGVTWTRQSHGNGDGNGIHAVDASTIWAVSDNNTTWSADGGTNWQVVHSPTDTMGISAVDSQRAWAVTAGQFPTIQWTTNGGTTWLTQTQLNGGTLPSLFTVSFAPTPLELPILRLTQSSPSQATLSWPTNTAGFVLQTTLALPSSTWITVTNAPTIGIHNQFNLSVGTTNARQFYRLQHP